MPYSDPNSVVDVLKGMGKNSDLASRATLAVQYNLAKTPEEYIAAANAGNNASQNIALINALKGVGNNGQTSGNAQSPTFNANANTSAPAKTTDVALPGASSTPPAATPGTTSTPTTDAVRNLAYPTKPTDLTDEQIKAKAQTNIGGQVIPDTSTGVPMVNGRKVYKSVNGNWIYDDNGSVAGTVENNDPLVKQKEAAKAQNDIYMNQELEATNLQIKHANDLLQNSLAARGILGNSSEAIRLIKEQDAENQTLTQKIKDKYNVMNAGLDASLAAEIQARLDKEITKIKTDQAARLKDYYDQSNLVQTALKDQQDAEYKNKTLELQKQQQEIDKKFKEGSLTIDQYNAQSQRITAEANAAKAYADAKKTTAETVPAGGNTQTVTDQVNRLKTSIAKAQKLAGASGDTGVLGRTKRFLVGTDDYTNLVAETNAIRTNVLTLATDPTIKKFFGPQMSNADVQLMTSAGTTLNPELQSPENLRAELTRLQDLANRMSNSVPSGGGSDNATAKEGDTNTYNGITYKVINGVWTPQ